MKKRYRDKAVVKKRVYLTLCGLSALLLVLTLRLSYIMIFKSEEYSAMAVEQWTSEVKIAAKRGKILDRNENDLAVSANVYRIDFDLNAIRAYNTKKETTNDQLAEKIGEAADIPKEDVLKKLEFRLPTGAAAGSATLIRRIEKEPADKVKELKINGVIVSPDTRRYYPNNNFLAQVLGNTNSDGVGLNGVELQYDKQLSGVPGIRIAELDRSSNDLPYTISNFTPPVDGKDVVLTVDEKIQLFAEKAADIALKENNADSATIIVMNPKSGEVLAMANKPDFNPNNPYEGADKFEGNTSTEKLQKMWRNRAVSDTFEPGSIFKVVTASAGLEVGVAGGNESYVCNGSLTIANRNIKCWKAGGHGVETFTDIIKNSCNVGFMQLGQRIGKENLNEYIKKFGLGQKSGVDLPGEAKGIIKKTEDITDVDLATISFGQANTVNPIQFMTSVNAIANGGTLIQPHVMKEVTHVDDNGVRIVDEKFVPETKKIIDEKTAKVVREAMEKVVTEGSAKGTYIEGYRIGGKTGTAQKVNTKTGGYGGGYIASFIGLAPVDDPQITVMVSIDNPKNGEYYGGRVAVPIAHILFSDIFNYMDAGSLGFEKPQDEQYSVIPEVRGLKVEEAKKILKENNLQCEITGEDSYIKDVNPKPGYMVKAGSNIKLYTGSASDYNKDVIVPELNGYSKEMAEKVINNIGLKVVFDGEGSVCEQSINAGEVVKSGTVINVTLGVE